jgi:hypothetical protein
VCELVCCERGCMCVGAGVYVVVLCVRERDVCCVCEWRMLLCGAVVCGIAGCVCGCVCVDVYWSCEQPERISFLQPTPPPQKIVLHFKFYSFFASVTLLG